MTDRATTVQRFYTTALERYWADRDAAAPSAEFLPGGRVPRARADEPGAALPATVRESFAYYYSRVEQADWGSVTVWRAPVDGRDTYAVRVTTDGDDGWLEIFDTDGTPLGAARTNVEVAVFEPRETTRARIDDNSFPPALATRAGRG